MVDWPAGHRIEDYQFKIYDSAFAWLGDLATVHGAAGSRTLYGQFGGKCTFALSLDDPWASVLSAESQHFLKVLRDGVQIFSGMQVKLEREDEPAKESGFVKFQFLPLAFLARWRHCLPIPPATTLETSGTKVDDAFKWIVERVLGSTAPNTPTTGLSRAISGFTVAADKTEYPTNVGLDPTNQNLYEFLQRWGANFDVDWDIYLNASDAPEFETWYPRRGLDRSEANGTNAEAVFTDELGDILRVSYGMDTTDAKTVIISADGLVDVAASVGDRTAWLIREGIVRNRDTTTMGVALEDKRPKVWCKLEEYQETRGLQWKEGAVAADACFSVGDLVTWYAVRMGYGPTSDTICQIDWEIDANGVEHLTLTFGDPKPDIMDKMRGGTGGATDPDYTDPGASLRVLGITGTDTNTVYPAVGTNNWTFAAGTGIASITAAVASTVTFNTVWQRGTAPGEAALYPAITTDALAIANDFTVWSDTIGGTQTAGFDNESGGCHAVGWLQVGDPALGTPACGIKLTHNAEHPDINIVSGGSVMGAWRSATGSIDLYQGADLTLRKVAADAWTFLVDGATGSTQWAPGATWQIEGATYTLPTGTPVATGYALICTDAGVMTWASPAAAAHDIIGALHTYTGGSALDVIGLSAANTLAVLTPSSAPGAASAILKSDASGYLRLQRLELQGASDYITVGSSDLTINAGSDDLALKANDKIFLYPSASAGIVYQFDTTAFIPGADNSYALGGTSYRWSVIYAYDAHFYDDVVIDGDCTITGTPKLGTLATKVGTPNWTRTLTISDKYGTSIMLMVL